MAYNPLQNTTKLARSLYKTLLRRSKELDTVPKGIFTWPSKIHKYWNEYDPHQSLEKDGKSSLSSTATTTTIQTQIQIQTQTQTQTQAIQNSNNNNNNEMLSIATATATATAATTTLQDRFTARIRYAFKKPSARKRTSFMFNGSSNTGLSNKKDSLDEWTKNEFQKCFDIVQIINRTIALGSDVYQHKILRLQFILQTWTLLAKNPEQFRQKFVPYDEKLILGSSNAIFGAMLVEAIHFDRPLRQHIKNTLQVLHEQIIRPIRAKNPRNIHELNQILFEEIFTGSTLDAAQVRALRERLNAQDLLLHHMLVNRHKPLTPLMSAILYPYIYEQIFGNPLTPYTKNSNISTEFSPSSFSSLHSPKEISLSSPTSSVENKQLYVLWIDRNSCIVCEQSNTNNHRYYRHPEKKLTLSENTIILNIADGGVCSTVTTSEFRAKYIKRQIVVEDKRTYGCRKWVEVGNQNDEESAMNITNTNPYYLKDDIPHIADKDLWLQLLQHMLWCCQRATVPKEKQAEHMLLTKFWFLQWTHLHFNPHATNTLLSLESGTL